IPSPEGERKMTNAHLKVLHFDLESSTPDPVRSGYGDNASKHRFMAVNIVKPGRGYSRMLEGNL
ncbi:hypothetical protein, partial [Paramuribaculum intestinale]